MDKILTTAIEAAKAAGEIALRYFRTNLAVEIKADKSPVTEADRLCEAKIVEVLRATGPPNAGRIAERGAQNRLSDTGSQRGRKRGVFPGGSKKPPRNYPRLRVRSGVRCRPLGYGR